MSVEIHKRMHIDWGIWNSFISMRTYLFHYTVLFWCDAYKWKEKWWQASAHQIVEIYVYLATAIPLMQSIDNSHKPVHKERVIKEKTCNSAAAKHFFLVVF